MRKKLMKQLASLMKIDNLRLMFILLNHTSHMTNAIHPLDWGVLFFELITITLIIRRFIMKK